MLHVAPSLAAHVTVVLLQSPEAQTAAACEQSFVCSPSLGIAVPLVSFAMHVYVVRSQ
jgi:hypothetical protein